MCNFHNMLNDAFIFVIQWLLKKHLIYFQYINQVFQQDVEGGISTYEIIQRSGKAILLKCIEHILYLIVVIKADIFHELKLNQLFIDIVLMKYIQIVM